METRNIVITGANRGIGYKMVETFAKDGANIFACARKEDEEFLAKIDDLAKQNKVSVTPIFFDMKCEEDIVTGIKKIMSVTKDIDVLINCAGMTKDSLFQMTSVKQVREVFEVNFFSQFIVTQYIAKAMIRRKKGSIITVSSVAAMECEKGRLAYGASKAASSYAMKELSMELGEYGIRVNCISPGFIDTDMWKSRDEKVYESILKETPIGRQGEAEEVAQLALFLASDKAAYITGQNYVIDGGRKKSL